jgi:hypothetical protein
VTPRLAAAAVLAALVLVPVADAAKKKPPAVKAPKSGRYKGHPRGKDLTLYVSGKSIDIAVFSFKCADTTGLTSIDAIALKKTSKGYKFAFSGMGSITFQDGKPDENGKVSISGLFTRTGRKATGGFRVRSPRCGDTGNVEWSAKR